MSEREFLFTEENAPSPSCHASTLAAAEDGTLVCAWFGGTREGADDVEIWLSRREAGGWMPAVRVSCEPGPHWNPVLFPMDGGLGLFYKAGKPIAAWRTVFRFSKDGGQSWSAPRELVPGDAGGRGPVKNKPIRLADGAILAPASCEGLAGDFKWRAFADRSEDEGRTWTRSAYFGADANLIQPTLWESAPGRVHALLRSDAGRIYRADSEDGGRSWQPARPSAMPNNNSGLDAAYDGRRLWLCCNPVAENWGPRSPLTLFVSEDNGGTFAPVCELENDKLGEYSYPAVICRDKTLFVSYTWRRERIAFRSFRV